MTQNAEPDDYYPFRWKVADAVEDLFLLHRAKLIGVLALAGLAAFVLAVMFLDNDGSDTVTTATTENPATTAPFGDRDSTTTETPSTSTTTSSTTSTTSTTTSSTTTTTTTTTTIPESSRSPESPEQLAATQAGAIVDLSTSEISLVGGLPDDATADATLALAQQVFPDTPTIDRQIVDDSFEAPNGTVLRLAAPDLFGYNSDALNSTYLPLIDQIAAAAIEQGWSVEVSGHTDNTGPPDGNQRLSERRAASAAARLRAQGVPSDKITVVGRGEDQPIATNSTEAGRLQNRRVEFLVTP